MTAGQIMSDCSAFFTQTPTMVAVLKMWVLLILISMVIKMLAEYAVMFYLLIVMVVVYLDVIAQALFRAGVMLAVSADIAVVR